jgi:hypothetical protein
LYLSGTRTPRNSPVPTGDIKLESPLLDLSGFDLTLHNRRVPKAYPARQHQFVQSTAAKNTTRMALSSLPLEILQQIGGCVETLHWPSLFTFSLTSKACHRASALLILRKINIKIAHDGKGLQRDTDRLMETLSRMDSARHVQCITIKGDMRPSVKKKGNNLEWLRETGLDEILVDWNLINHSSHYVVYDEPVIKKSSDEDLAWTPIVRLLQAIPYLRDLVYDCQSQFPPSLLSTIHKLPQCRLHHLSFRFRTLLWGVPYPYEMELATSPSLYRVKLFCTWRDSDYDDDFNEEAMMELAAGLAPDLKEVSIQIINSDRSGRDYRARESWQGLPGSTRETMGSLKSLSLKGFMGLRSPKLLRKWAKYTDFASIQHLCLGGDYDSDSPALSGETMEWIAQNHLFPQLRTLSVYLSRDDMMDEKPHYSQNAVSFFQDFEPLEELSVHGPMDSQIIDAILSNHGLTLTKLVLRPFESHTYTHVPDTRNQQTRKIPLEFTRDHFQQIQAQY